MSTHTWSLQQDRIFEFVETQDGHLVCRARAGCGKTTTIVEAVKRRLRAVASKKIVVCAFNKRIAEELTTRFVGFPVEVKTLHSIGFKFVMRNWTGVKPEDRNHTGTRRDSLTQAVCGGQTPDAIKKLVGKLHTLGRETRPHATSGADLIDLAEEFDLVPEEEWEEEGWTVERVCDLAARAMALGADRKPADGFIDFADMIFLPVRNGWLRKWWDEVVVDEAQDMTVTQLEIAQGICRGRIVVVGDDRQAIYGFRGADSGSLDRLKATLQATEKGLTTTYRCGKVIVAAAARIVPDFTAGPNNPEGEILGLLPGKLAETAEPGDFVLSRTKAPLTSYAMKLLRAGKRTVVAGKNIGDTLAAIVRRVSKSSRSVPEFLGRLAGWEAKEIKRATKSCTSEEAKAARAEEVIDRAETIRCLADDARNVAEITDRIEALFTDTGLGQAGVITCSTVHRAKGLEANRVFLIADTFRDATTEEQNICYVAITRAKNTLVIVGSPTCASIPTVPQPVEVAA